MRHNRNELLSSCKPQLEDVFSNDKSQIIEFAKKLEECTYAEMSTEISEYFNLKKSSGSEISSIILAIVHSHLSHNKQWTEELDTSSLDNKIKENILEFIKSLSEKTINKLNLFYLSDSQMINEPNRISEIGEELSFKLIQNENGDVIGQLPVVSLKLGTAKDNDAVVSHIYTLTKKDLISIVNILNHIVDKQNKLLNNYGEKFGDTLVR